MPFSPPQAGPFSTGLTREIFYSAQDDFGFVGDLITVFDGAMTSGSATLTCATSAPFKSTDVGKRVTVARAGASGAQLTTTISAFTSSSVVTLSATAGSTTSGACGVSFGTDNTAAITLMTSTLNGAAFPGAVVEFGQSATNSYGWPISAIFTSPVSLRGIGSCYSADVGDYTRLGGTRLAWWGTSSDGGTAFGAMLAFNSTGINTIKAPSLRDIFLDCRNGDQNQALHGLVVASAAGMRLDSVFVCDSLAGSIRLGISTTPTEAKDTTRFLLTELFCRQLDNPATPAPVTTAITTSSAVVLTASGQSLTVAANTLPASGYIWVMTTAGMPTLVNYTGGGGTTTLTGCTVNADDVVHTPTTVSGSNIVQAVPGNAYCVRFNGGSTANTCCGTFIGGQLSHGTTWGPAALEFSNSDSIDTIQLYINGGNATNDGAINRVRKPGVRLNGSIVSATLASRNNTFRGGDPGIGGVCNMGATNAGARLLAQAGPNYWDLYQLGNGAPVPVAELNSAFDWTPNGGWRDGARSVSVADQAIPAATLTLITGSLLWVPPQGFQIGTVFRWTVTMSKTATGVTSTRSWFVKIGTTGTTSDTTVATLTNASVPTAAADQGRLVVEFTVRGPLGASCAGVATSELTHNAATTGFSPKAIDFTIATMATWNSATAQQFISLHLQSQTSEVITIQQCITEVVCSGNP